MAMMHAKVFRAIECIARYYASQEAKEQIRHRGEGRRLRAPQDQHHRALALGNEASGVR